MYDLVSSEHMLRQKLYIPAFTLEVVTCTVLINDKYAEICWNVYERFIT